MTPLVFESMYGSIHCLIRINTWHVVLSSKSSQQTSSQGLKSDIRIFDLAVKSGKQPKNSVDISTKRDFVILIGACDSLSTQNPPTSWSDAESKLEIVDKHNDLNLHPDMQRLLSVLKGKESLHEIFLQQEEVDMAPYCFIAQPYYTEKDLAPVESQTGESQSGDMSLPCWSSGNVSLRYTIATTDQDIENAVQSHRDVLFCDASFDMVKSVKCHGRGRERCIQWLHSILQPWDEDEDERATWRAQTPQALVVGVTTTMNVLRGMLRVVSDVPGDCGSEPSHLELALPWACCTHGVKGPKVESHLGTMNRAGAVMQKHMMDDKDWKAMRQAAEASKNVDAQMSPEYRQLCDEQCQSHEMPRAERISANRAIADRIIKMQESGVRPAGCEKLWLVLEDAIATDLAEGEKEAEEEGRCAELLEQLEQMQSLMNIMSPARKEALALHTRCSSIISGLQTKNAASGLETLLKKKGTSLSEQDLKSLLQHYRSAAAANKIDNNLGIKLHEMRATVWSCLVDVLCHFNEKFSAAHIEVHMNVLEAFNSHIFVVKAAGGRAADSVNLQMLKEMPKTGVALRESLFQTECAEDKGEVERCCTEYLPKLVKDAEAWAQCALKYQGGTEEKLAKYFLPGVEKMLSGMTTYEKKADTMIAKFAGIQAEHITENLRNVSRAFAKTAGGHNKKEGEVWYTGLSTSDCNKIATLHARFKESLAESDMMNTVDRDLASLKKDRIEIQMSSLKFIIYRFLIQSEHV